MVAELGPKMIRVNALLLDPYPRGQRLGIDHFDMPYMNSVVENCP